MANSVDPDQMPHFVASDLGLHCLPRPICPNTLSECGSLFVCLPCSIIIFIVIVHYKRGIQIIIFLLISHYFLFLHKIIFCVYLLESTS